MNYILRRWQAMLFDRLVFYALFKRGAPGIGRRSFAKTPRKQQRLKLIAIRLNYNQF